MIAFSLDCGCKGTAFFVSSKLLRAFFACIFKRNFFSVDYQKIVKSAW